MWEEILINGVNSVINIVTLKSVEAASDKYKNANKLGRKSIKRKEEADEFKETIATNMNNANIPADMMKYHEDVLYQHKSVDKFHKSVIAQQESVDKYYDDVKKYHEDVMRYHEDVNNLNNIN